MDPAASREWLEFIESWHEFFLMAGTAAVTLAGLLFVALSLHIEALIHEEREHLLALARATLFSFTMVLVLSLMMLVPLQRQRLVAFELMVVGGNFILLTLRQLRWKPKKEHAGFSAGLMRRRMIFPMVAYSLVLFSGLMLFLTGLPEWMYFVIGAVCMVLGNAAGTSWDLLVRVAQMKRDAA
jgi:hypothetical protein